MLTPSLPTEATAGNPVSAWRRIQAGMVEAYATGAPRTGVLAASSSTIVTGTADLAMTYQIGQFVAATSRDGVGVEFVANDATETVSTTAAPSSNSRVDVIWVRCRFPSLTDTGQTAPVFGVTQGVANASPSKPSIPAGALELATAVVTSSDLATQTVVITQTFPWAAMAGGTVPLRNAAEQTAWAPADGSTAYRIDTNTPLVRISGAWSTSKTASWKFVRPSTSDDLVSTDLGTNVGLMSSTIAGAPPGLYMVIGRASLYAASGQFVVGRVYVEWGPSGSSTREMARWDIPNQGSYPTSPTVSAVFVHPGGDLRVGVGYSRAAGNYYVTGQASGETVVTAVLLGPA